MPSNPLRQEYNRQFLLLTGDRGNFHDVVFAVSQALSGVTIEGPFETPGWLEKPSFALYRATGDEETSVGVPPELQAELGFRVECRSDVAAMVAINLHGHALDVHADLAYAATIGGAPWTAMGSPWTDLTPIPPPPSPPLGEPPDLFWEQWALGKTAGINLALGSESKAPTTGDRIRVGVFDTWPLAGHLDRSISASNWTSARLSDLEVTVRSEIRGPTFDWSPWPAPGPRKPVPDHGLAVCGLIHGLARDAEVTLYPVLNDYGACDLVALVFALNHFVEQYRRDRDQPGGPTGAVINLSLGCHPPQDVAARLLHGPWAHFAPGHLTPSELTLMWYVQPHGPMSLRHAILRAYKAGIVVVGAAGNEREGKPSAVEPQYPAAFPTCLAVAASNKTRTQSCFSNLGQVQAPGGDGVQDCQVCEDESKISGYSVVAPVRKPQASPTGLAHCAGTSFATPMVSGLAALVLEAIESGAIPRDPGVDLAQQVMAIVRGQAPAAPFVPVPVVRKPFRVGGREIRPMPGTEAALEGEPRVSNRQSGIIDVAAALDGS